ncbi:hypothetical protein ACQ4PT_026334 [Festuca glaucescens]
MGEEVAVASSAGVKWKCEQLRSHGGAVPPSRWLSVTVTTGSLPLVPSPLKAPFQIHSIGNHQPPTQNSPNRSSSSPFPPTPPSSISSSSSPGVHSLVAPAHELLPLRAKFPQGRKGKFPEKASREVIESSANLPQKRQSQRTDTARRSWSRKARSQTPMGSSSRGGRRSGLFLLLSLHLLCLHSSLRCSVSAAGGAGSGAPYVGVTIGTAVTNLLSPSDLAEFLRAERITHVRLYDADPRLLSALASSGATAIVGVPNDELLALGSSPATASAWVARRVLPFAAASSKNPGLISAIAVGDEAYFNQSLAKSFLLPLLSHLANTSAPLMLNLYPYYALMQSGGVVPVDNAMFKPLPPSLEMVDPNTLLHYTNVFDAMLDAVYVAVKNLNVTTGGGAVPVLVTETGWPSYGDRKLEPYASRDNANTYNSNLIKHVATDKPGTPMRPGAQASVYIYELFNEDLRPGPVSEANWGLFHGNGTPVYLLHVNGTDGFLGNDTTDRTFCIAADDADEKAVQAAMDWACGPGRILLLPGRPAWSPPRIQVMTAAYFLEVSCIAMSPNLTVLTQPRRRRVMLKDLPYGD